MKWKEEEEEEEEERRKEEKRKKGRGERGGDGREGKNLMVEQEYLM